MRAWTASLKLSTGGRGTKRRILEQRMWGGKEKIGSDYPDLLPLFLLSPARLGPPTAWPGKPLEEDVEELKGDKKKLELRLAELESQIKQGERTVDQLLAETQARRAKEKWLEVIFPSIFCFAILGSAIDPL